MCLATQASEPAGAVSLESLLTEMTSRSALARWPEPSYRSLQASSYNRASTHRDAPGWFADGDGTGFIRTEELNGRTDWVLMEHDGPGCIAKMWTPFFYFDFHNRSGPNLRIYVDGSPTPVLDEGFISLTRGEGSFKPPFGAPTARAGDTYLPIPFAKSCKITLTGRPFYHIINYRAYPAGTAVETFSKERLHDLAAALASTGKALYEGASLASRETREEFLHVPPGDASSIELPPGPAAVSCLTLKIPAATNLPALLRSTVLAAEFDGERTIWIPVGDLFSSPDSLHPFHTWERTVTPDGTLSLRWLMPYREKAVLRLENHAREPVSLTAQIATSDWAWDDRSMHFHAAWRPDDLLPGTPFVDWGFVDIRGKGVFLGDAWTVLNPTQGWWGEGDEKIYVDDAWERGFPTHFGTGTEDYYGWAGGVNPTREDEFDEPFLANVRVGGVDGNHTRGFNICTRTRVLDAIPFERRLRFDMEASPGTEQRRASDFLGYSAVTFWYARPGGTDDAPPRPDAAGRPIMSLDDLAIASQQAAAPRSAKGAIECETLKPSAQTPGLVIQNQRPAESMRPEQWSGERHLFLAAKEPGDFVELTISEQFAPRNLVLFVTESFDFGIARIAVNGKIVVDQLDLFSPQPRVKPVVLGRVEPVNNSFVIRYELLEANPRARGARTYLGLDYLRIDPSP